MNFKQPVLLGLSALGGEGGCNLCLLEQLLHIFCLMFSQVMGNPGTFQRSLMFSALSYLGFETYQLLSPAAVVHAAAKGKSASF